MCERYITPSDGVPAADLSAFQSYTLSTVFGMGNGIDADVSWLKLKDAERLGYPTQKPLGLLGRIIEASSDPGDLVMDPWFEWWAVSLVNAVPYKSKKKGVDSGIDGIIYFKSSGKKTERVIVSVKGGKNFNVSMIRDLKAVVEREKARMGVFITLYEPTKPMKTEALKAGYYDSGFGKHEKIQIRTIKQLLDGQKTDIPMVSVHSLKKAKKELGKDKQQALL
jgi:hypothetical protein